MQLKTPGVFIGGLGKIAAYIYLDYRGGLFRVFKKDAKTLT